MGYGMNAYIGLAKESSWGTPVAATDYVEALSENLTQTIERFDVRNLVGRLSEPDDMAGMRRLSGDIVLPGHPVSIGHFLRGAYGTMSGSVVLSGFLFKEIFTPITADWDGSAPVPPYTFEIFRDVTSSNRYAGGLINRLTMVLQPNQDARFTANVIAKTTSVVAKSGATFPGSPADPFAFDTVSLSVGGAASALYEAITVTLVDNQLSGIPTLNNTTDIAKIKRTGPQMVRMTGTIGFDDLAEYKNFIDQTEQRFVVSLYRAASHQLVVDMPRVVYTAFPLGAAGRDRLTVGFEGMARYHAGSGRAIQVDLTTTKSNY